MRLLLHALVLLAVTAGAARAAENWVSVAGARPGIRFEVDAGSIVRRGDRVEFWERVEYESPTVRDEASLRLIKVKKVLRVMDCKARTQGFREAMAFSTDARLIEHVLLGSVGIQMDPVPPRTIAAWQLEWACAKAMRDAR
ncbi:MAG: hypothetical protein IT515_07175 [Burkholderiales bacterium]|nr:hypothetical protein [Burkholderiales bacterium]